MSLTAPPAAVESTTSSSDTIFGFAIERVVAVLTPIAALFAGWITPLVEKNIPGVHVTAVTVEGTTIALVVGVVATGAKWLHGRQIPGILNQAPKLLTSIAGEVHALEGNPVDAKLIALIEEKVKAEVGKLPTIPGEAQIEAFVKQVVAKAAPSEPVSTAEAPAAVPDLSQPNT